MMSVKEAIEILSFEQKHQILDEYEQSKTGEIPFGLIRETMKNIEYPAGYFLLIVNQLAAESAFSLVKEYKTITKE